PDRRVKRWVRGAGRGSSSLAGRRGRCSIARAGCTALPRPLALDLRRIERSYLQFVSVRRRAFAWIKDDPFGVELAKIELDAERLTADGVAIGTSPVQYQLDYRLETAARFVTSRLRVTSRGDGWRRALDLRRTAAGVWDLLVEEDGDLGLPSGGGDPGAFAEALDCDLGLSPVTNLMPVLRNDLLAGGGPIELITAWVSVPDLN